ncbi:MAG: metallophosphoesterase [Firmicutes bacterium]|nr:metallophosphoesterase [Bacillota bacterium]
MKILIVADDIHPRLYEHYNPDLFPPIDFIISCGDLQPWYLSYLMSCFNAPLFYVRGNHDTWIPDQDTDGGENLAGRVITHKKIRMAGFEGSRFCGSPDSLQYTERQMRRMSWKVQCAALRHRGLDIIVTHSPPFGIHDADDPTHMGFLTYVNLINKYQPKYFIHGHTHLNYGHNQKRITTLGETTIINGYGYFILDYEQGVSEIDRRHR